MDGKMRAKRHKVLFGVRRSVRYHSRRWRFFDRLNQVFSFVFVLFGAAAILAMFQGWPFIPQIAAAIVTIAGGIDLVVGTARMSCLHQALMRQFITLEKDIVRIDPEAITDEEIREFKARQLDIEVDEPPVMRGLNVLCHNEVSRSLGYGRDVPGAYIPLGRMRRWLAQFVDFEDDGPETAPQAS
jgi:hypothetical protein